MEEQKQEETGTGADRMAKARAVLAEKRAQARPDRSVPVRVPLHRQKKVPFEGLDKEKFHYHLVIDTGSRIRDLQVAGYEIVLSQQEYDPTGTTPTKEGTNVTRDVGGGRRAFLMRIPKEFYEQDQAEKQKLGPDRFEQQMKKEQAGGMNPGPALTDT